MLMQPNTSSPSMIGTASSVRTLTGIGGGDVARILAHVVDDLRLARSSRLHRMMPFVADMRNGCSKTSRYAPACARNSR